eukprot:4824651-Lingulodinium_polyedra.AAC.1
MDLCEATLHNTSQNATIQTNLRSRNEEFEDAGNNNDEEQMRTRAKTRPTNNLELPGKTKLAA